MTLKDLIASRAKPADETPTLSAEERYRESYRVRAKMIGLLLRDARQSAGQTLESLAGLVQIDPAQLETYENGEDAPSLPQLELLAVYLNVPVSHFWGAATLESQRRDHRRIQNEYLALRDRVIGLLLRNAREARGLTIELISENSGLDQETLARYEDGELSIPMHELTVLADQVHQNLGYFLESGSQIGQILAMREAAKQFAGLPDEVRGFAANPLNVGFIEIAQALAQMPTERLRRIGESVLNITM